MITLDMREICSGSSCWDEQGFHSVTVNPQWGTGYISAVIPLQRDIFLVTQNFSLQGDTKIKMIREEPSPGSFLAFSICLSGVSQLSYDRPRMLIGQEFANIVISEHRECLSMTVKASSPVQTIDVCMPLSAFETLTGRNSNELIHTLEQLDRQAAGKTSPHRSKQIDMAQKICGNQIFMASTTLPQDTFFLEAKALELAALQLKQLDLLTGAAQQAQEADPSTEKILYACEILKKEMASPPSILDLSLRVGLNHTLLTQGFQKILGQTPFRYLRAIRLEKAHSLLASRQYNVTEAALEVGYESLSHFTKNFYQAFGINPKALQKASAKHDFS